MSSIWAKLITGAVAVGAAVLKAYLSEEQEKRHYEANKKHFKSCTDNSRRKWSHDEQVRVFDEMEVMPTSGGGSVRICPVCGDEMEFSRFYERGEYKPRKRRSWTIDHIHPLNPPKNEVDQDGEPYYPGCNCRLNLQPLCGSCNSRKNNKTGHKRSTY